MEYRIREFIGLNQSAHPLMTGMEYAVRAANVSTVGGSLRRMGGCARYVSGAHTGGIGTLMAFYRRAQGVTTPKLLALNATRISVWEAGAWQALYLSESGNDAASYLNYQHDSEDVLLIGDGVRPVLRWDGVDDMAALSGCDQLFSQLALHYERVWGAGVQSDPDGVYWSRAYDPEDWTSDEDVPDAGGGVLKVPTWNGGSVVAIRTLFDDVLVFKDEDLFRIVGTYPGEYEVVRVHGAEGPIAKNTIVSTADQCFFLSRNGLCAYTGVRVARIGDETARAVFARVNRTYAANACAVVHKGVLRLALPLDDSTVNNAVLEIDLTRGAYTLREGVSVRSFLPFDDRLLMTDDAGHVLEYGVGDTADGQKIDAYWETPFHDLGSAGLIKHFRSLSMFASGTIDVTVRTESRKLTRRLRMGNALKPVTIPMHLSGYGFQMTLQNVDGADFEIAPGATIAYDG